MNAAVQWHTINAHATGAQPGYRRCKTAVAALIHLSPSLSLFVSRPQKQSQSLVSCGLRCSAYGMKSDSGFKVSVLMRVESKKPVVWYACREEENGEWGFAAHGNCCQRHRVALCCESPHCPTPSPAHPPTHHPMRSRLFARTLIKPNWITHSRSHTAANQNRAKVESSLCLLIYICQCA
jgi:hypothetical protein